MNSEYLSIENAKKLKEYDKMLETISILDKRNNELNRKVIDLEEQLENKAYNELITQLEKLQEESKRLKEEYVMLQNASDEVEEKLQEELEQKNKIIEKIKNIIDLNQYNYGYQIKQEIEKLEKEEDYD